MSDKKFGLIIPKKADKFKMQVKSVFGDDSDDDEKQTSRPKIPQKKAQLKSKIKQETLEDPSIYEYDSIYDDMKAKEAESIAPKEKKNSRYIETLLKAAEKRKKEYERRIDKKIQAERENEGDMYEDKEEFVTSSYKKKLQEKEEEEERERRENMLNDMMDVSKQKDLSGFYRHFLKQTVGEEKMPVFGAKDIKKEVISRENSPVKGPDEDDTKKLDLANIDQDSDGIEIDSESDASDSKYKKSTGTDDISRKGDDDKDENLRRKTNRSDELSDKSKHLPERKKHKTHHRRANKSSSSDSLSSDDEDVASSKKGPHSSRKPKSHSSKHDSSSDSGKVSKSYQKKKQKESSKSINSSANTKSSINTNCSSSSDSELGVKNRTLSKKSSDSNKKARKHRSRHDSSLSDDDDNEEKESLKQTEEDKAAKKNKSKKNIYTKRTVGDIFISAQARYFQRMALKP